ncbi:MAG: DNA gyrase/topoisomerase IV subunit A [Bacteroidales bacterium]|jgi:topoisomerase-4 subunit A|nr:DNA gyrase/topoisomerase IV subunit A [Bacteroidales bacterium]
MSEEQINNSTDNEKNTEDTANKLTVLSGMYQDWFLDYASYVILERAVPHVYDGLKPVQRRILHSMKQLDDGRYNKVANIIGHTMQYHPHGDTSIGDALVQLGQKDLLIDAQGNWGNILTGDSSAAPRYIEARLTKFALEVVFNPKTTFWKSSYDGRNKEPITLPVKFPLLLAQGVEGIAVGLASKILPHNFNELIDACVATLKEEDFELYPDFPTGGMIDVTRYNDGLRGGKVRVRAHIEKQDKRTLVITDVPFGETTSSVIDSIIAANDKGKIKVKKIDDNTSSKVEILVHLPNNVSPDKTIDALYAFTKCEVPISPNSCVIEEDRPRFLGVKEMLQISVYNTMELLKQELLIKKKELEEQLFLISLEKWFIENRVYKESGYENAKSTEIAIKFINTKLKEHKTKFIREATNDDLLKLLEIRMKRILKFNADKADELMVQIKGEIEEIEHNLNHLVNYTITYYKNIKLKYGKGRERKTEIRSFDNIDTATVAVANEKLYADFKEGFVGTSMKKNDLVCECSDIDDIIVFRRDGTYIISKVSEKAFFGKDIIHIDVFKRNDKRTIYNVVYKDGKGGKALVKRFAVTSVTRDKEYNLTKGTEGSKILYFSANPNGEAETIKVYLKPRPKLRKLVFEFDMKDVLIKGRNSTGNILTKNDIHKITLKEEGVSTLGGRKIWFDDVVLRLNAEGRGKLIGEFKGEDKILVVRKNGTYRLTNFDLTNHYEDDILVIEKFNPDKIWTAIHFDATQEYFYLKRFQFDDTTNEQFFISEDEGSSLLELSDDKYPQVKISFAGKHSEREPELIDAQEFIAVKSYRARGKRLTTHQTGSIKFDVPIIKEENNDIPDNNSDIGTVEDNNKNNNPDSPTQMSLEL